MENEAKKASKVWLVPTIIAAVLLVALIAFMLILGKGTKAVSDGTQTLAESVAPLKDGTAQLSDGVDQYTEGVDTIHKAMPTLTDGIQQYTEGVDTLNGYMETLNSAAPTLASGVQQLADGSTSLKSGVDAYTGGVDKVADGITQLNGKAPVLVDAINQLAAGAKSLNEGINGKDGKGLKSKKKNLANGIRSLSDGLALLNSEEAMPQLNDGIQKLATIIPEGVKGLDAAEANIKGKDVFASANDQVAAFTSALRVATGLTASQADAAPTKVTTFGAAAADFLATCQQQGVNPTDPSAIAANPTVAAKYATYDAALKALSQQEMAYVYVGAQVQGKGDTVASLLDVNGGPLSAAYATEVSNNATAITTYVLGYKTASANIRELNAQVPAMAKGSQQVTDGIAVAAAGAKALDEGVNGKDGKGLESKKNNLSNGIAKVSAGLETLQGIVPTLTGGISQLFDGSQQLKEKSGALRDGAGQLSGGVATLNSSVNGKNGLVSSVAKLYKDGSAKLAENSQALRDGVKQLADGAKKLSENSKALRDGASQLKEAAPALIDGIGQLKDGAKQVNGFTPVH